MKSFLFFLIALLVVSSYGEESAPKQRRRSSFYFDITLGGYMRYLGAVQTISTKSNESGSGCHFESDGRYVCGSGTSSEEMSVDNEKDIGYIGGGPLLGMRFGTLIKSVFALFANFELEKTDGKVLGREEDDDARPRSVLLGGGPGVAFYPFRHSVMVIKNIYIVGAVNLLIGGGGGIGAAGVGMNFETGYLIPASERINIGLAVGVDYLSTGGLNSDIKKERGFGIWSGLKFVRK
ncbi:MAG: hypothetical protein II835_07370 [Fibrobacter sp.]|nr:hypothetical protein [Fibrobacter sp.]